MGRDLGTGQASQAADGCESGAPASTPTAGRAIDTTTDDALGTSDMVDLLARLARREVCPAELRAAALARAHAADVYVNAVTHWFDATVRTEVTVPGDAPLAGIPTFFKDNEETTGYPTSQGSWAVADRPATACSPVTAAYLRVGLQPLGATTLPEFGLTASTESSRFGATRNPWDTSRSVGGSSGGSAALVAAGAVPLAHANDGGGSIRIPASCCGVVGLKPTRGRMPISPLKARAPVLITAQGVLTRTVRDTALFHAELERVHRVPDLPPIGHVTAPGRDRLRIGLCTRTLLGLPTSPDTVAAAHAAADLCAGLGHHVDEVGPPVGDGFGPDFLRYWSLLALLLHRRGGVLYGPGFDGSRVEPITRELSRMALRRSTSMPGALLRLRRLSIQHEADFARYDVLLTPVTGHPAPPIGHLGPQVEAHEHLVRLLRFALATPIQNVSGSPAISLPLGRTAAGLPIGVQFAAPFGRERRLLELALELEAAAPWPLTPGSR